MLKIKFFQRQKIAFFLRSNSNLYASVNSSFFEFKYFDLSKNWTNICNELQSFQPDVIAAQPSVLCDLAKSQIDNLIRTVPTQLISYAETLDQYTRSYILSVFNTKITEVYQATEGFLGSSCTHGTMHLNEDFIQFEREYVDQHRFYPIISDFSRHTQFVLKYQLDDLLEERTTPCPCGSALIAIEKIIGRADEVLIFGYGTQEIKLYPDVIAHRIAAGTDQFLRYLIRQHSPELLEISLDCNLEMRNNVEIIFREVFAELFKEYEIEHVKLEFNKNFHLTPAPKFRKIQRLF